MYTYHISRYHITIIHQLYHSQAASGEALENADADPRRAQRAASLEPALETEFQLLGPIVVGKMRK
jgi:hypothetical protein